jgi:hypothetical protein
VFSETNVLKNKNYHSILLQPFSYESEFHFWANIPGLLYTGMLVERHLGVPLMMAALLSNCAVSAGVTALYER